MKGEQNSVNHLLLNPQRGSFSFKELSQLWEHSVISLTLEGCGGIEDQLSILQALRGSVGAVMLEGASEAVLQKSSCTWNPPCASDVYFGPKPIIKTSISRHKNEIPKPFVLFAQSRGQDLVLAASIFGFARDYALEFRHALTSAVRSRMDWNGLKRDVFIPKTQNVKAVIESERLTGLDDVPTLVRLEMLTPFDSKNSDIFDNPALVFPNMANRVGFIARWYGADIEDDIRAISAAWRSLDIKIDHMASVNMSWSSTRTKQKYQRKGQKIDLIMQGDFSLLWPIIKLAEQVHIGRGATAGLGRFRVTILE